MAILEGVISKVIFTDLNSRFYIFNMEIYEKNSDYSDAPTGAIFTNRGKNYATITGNFPTGAIENQRYKIEGEWVQKKTGDKLVWNLKANYAEVLKTTDTSSLLSYLITFQGIGPKIAKAIITKYGEKTLVALSNPEEISKIKGISPEKAKRIAKLHRSSQRLLRLHYGLSKLGINDFKLVIKMDNYYGEKTEDMVINYPYQIYLDGICSFKTADTIAMMRKNKYATNDLSRLSAAYICALKDMANEGHCCIHTKELMTKMEEILINSKNSACKEPILEGPAKAALIQMLNNNDISRERIGEDIYCYLPSIRYAEREAAKRLKALASPTDDAIENEEEFIAKLENEFGIQYDTRQKAAIVSPGKSSLTIITGGPGTGKTTTTRGVICYIQEQKPDANILCLAPTGRAAQRMAEATGLPAQTIHRGLEVEAGGFGLMDFKRNEENPLNYDAIVIDEFSMVDILLFEALLKAIKPNTKLVIIGDKDQLPSVGPGCVLKDLIESGKIPVVTLALVFRQGKTSLIAKNSKAIIEGHLDTITFDNTEFVFVKKQGDEEIAETCIELFKRGLKRYNNDTNAVQILTPIRALNSERPNKTCCDALNPKLRDMVNPISDSKNEKRIGKNVFRVGDKVMQFNNNYEKNVMNGDLGYVVEIDEDCGVFAVQFGNKRVEYEQDEINELGLAYATTIHKSQGSEYPFVIMPICSSQGNKMLNRNLIYTGITRAKATVVIVGEVEAFEKAIRNTEIERRRTTLKERL